jgi:hypothetical protein
MYGAIKPCREAHPAQGPRDENPWSRHIRDYEENNPGRPARCQTHCESLKCIG